MLRGIPECPACGALPLGQQMLGGFGLLVALVVLAFFMVWVAGLLLGPYPSPVDSSQSRPAGAPPGRLLHLELDGHERRSGALVQSGRDRG